MTSTGAAGRFLRFDGRLDTPSCISSALTARETDLTRALEEQEGAAFAELLADAFTAVTELAFETYDPYKYTC